MTTGKRRKGNPRTDKERAARHFNKDIEDVTQKDIDNLPPRGTRID